MTLLADFVRQLPYLVPMLLIHGVGIGVSLHHRHRGRPATLALAGFGILFGNALASSLAQTYLLTSSAEHDGGVATLEQWLLLVNVVGTLLVAGAYALLLVAIFGSRDGVPAAKGALIPNPSASAGQPAPRAHRAGLVLLLGILSLVAFPPLGLAAWLLGNRDLAAMRAGQMDLAGEEFTRVGQFLGMVSTVLVELVTLLVMGLAFSFFTGAGLFR